MSEPAKRFREITYRVLDVQEGLLNGEIPFRCASGEEPKPAVPAKALDDILTEIFLDDTAPGYEGIDPGKVREFLTRLEAYRDRFGLDALEEPIAELKTYVKERAEA